ncbi:MAG: GTP-binding protein [Promethearchaeota archaeon]
MTKAPQKFTYKITVIGDGAVGKTSLIKKFSKGSFQEDYIKTIGAQFSTYTEIIDGNECTLFLWDIAGQDDFFFLRPAFYKETRGAIIVYSVEDNEHGLQSRSHIREWHDDIKKFCGKIPTILFANKIDLVDNVDLSLVEKVVQKRNFLGVYPTSAKTGDGVSNAFHRIIREIHYSK